MKSGISVRGIMYGNTDEDGDYLEWPDWCAASGWPFGPVAGDRVLAFPTGILTDLNFQLAENDWASTRGPLRLEAYVVSEQNVVLRFGDGRSPHGAELTLTPGDADSVQTVKTRDGRPCGVCVITPQAAALLTLRGLGEHSVDWPLVPHCYSLVGEEVAELVVGEKTLSDAVIFGARNGPRWSGAAAVMTLDVLADPLLPAISCLSDGSNFPVPIREILVLRPDLSDFLVPIDSTGSITIMVADLYGAPTGLVLTTASGVTLEFPTR